MTGQDSRLRNIRRSECPQHGNTLTDVNEAGRRFCVPCAHYVKAVEVEYLPASQLRGAVEEIVWLRAVLKRVELGHAVPTRLARDAIRESETRLPLGGSRAWP